MYELRSRCRDMSCVLLTERARRWQYCLQQLVLMPHVSLVEAARGGRLRRSWRTRRSEPLRKRQSDSSLTFDDLLDLTGLSPHSRNALAVSFAPISFSITCYPVLTSIVSICCYPNHERTWRGSSLVSTVFPFKPLTTRELCMRYTSSLCRLPHPTHLGN